MHTAIFKLYRQTPDSIIPSRITAAEFLPPFKYGELKISFRYEGNNFHFEVPFTRPYVDQTNSIFANLLNLNPQRREIYNERFNQFETEETINFFNQSPDGIPCSFEIIWEGKR